MVRSQYAATPTPVPPTLSKGIGTTTVASAGTKWVWLFCRCRAGVTLFSEGRSTVIAAGESLNITIPAAVKKPGSDIFEVGIAVGSDSNPGNACVLATYPMADGLGVPTPLPATVSLFRDAHFKSFGTAVNAAALPTGDDLIHGMRRYVDSDGRLKAYDSRSASWDAVFPQTFNPYVSNSQDVGGCDRPIKDITDSSVILVDKYAGDGSTSTGVKFWLVNDTSVAIPAKTKIRVSTSIGELDPDELGGLLKLTFLGHANVTTGAVDTSMIAGTPPTYPYQGDELTNLQTKADLPPGWAYVLEVRAEFSEAHLDNRLPQGEKIYFYPRFGINQSTYNPAGKALGNYIAAIGRRRRILPNGVGLNAIAADGEGCVAEYNFEDSGEVIVPGLVANTPDQFVLITNTGACYAGFGIPTDTAALRAVVSTVNGVGQLSAWSAVTLNPTTTLKITITHPTAIRDNYPDVIAGMLADLNANKLRVFVRVAGTTTSIQVFEAPTVGTGTEELFVAGTPLESIGSLPTAPANFGLFTPNLPAISASSGASSFAAGNYEVAVAYYFTDTLTVINHNYDTLAAKTIVELTGTVEDLFRAKAKGELNGPPGPAGAKGDQGERGLPGEQGPAGGAAFIRASVGAVTAVLAPNEVANIAIPLGKSFQLLSVASSHPAWVRLYTTAAKRTADAGRQITQAPQAVEHGVITDDVFSAGNLSIDYVSRGVFIFGASMESTPSASIPATVVNTGSTTTAITITYSRIEREV